MTDIAFHFNVSDKMAYACRLLRKATAAGARVVVTGSVETLHALDRHLWTFSALDFVPHCLYSASSDLLSASPVVLQPDLAQCPHAQVLLNLHPQVVDGYEKFQRVIELVTLDEAERQEARARWKAYQERGHTIVRHDVAARPEQA
jgi:DNA polymerase III subunit chi